MTPPVAVISDTHFHDIEGDFGFPGVIVGGRRLALRSWAETATSARAFNESGAALRFALDAIRARGVRHIVLLGDYTDDGQTETTHRLAAFLKEQRDLRFYAVPGNHDVFGPMGKHTATRLLAAPGRSVLVTSDPVLAAAEQDAVLTPNMRCHGQPAGLMPMASFGLSRQPEYLHWETPFGLSDSPDHRSYAAHSRDGGTTRHLMDASYLVEPEPGLWLLMIDANVFEPSDGDWQIGQKRAFIDPAAAGWNAIARVKPFLLDWIADVSARAAAGGKRLLTFSHYPALDPFGDSDGSEAALFGQTVIARRAPGPEAGRALEATGVRLHFSGHIHAFNDSACGTGDGLLREVALPSTTAFPPAFAILRDTAGGAGVEMVSITEMPLDPVFGDVYRAEAEETLSLPATFGTFLKEQMHRRILTRVVPRDWPADVAAILRDRNALQLVGWLLGGGSIDTPVDIDHLVARHGLRAGALEKYALNDLVVDWYLLRQAGALTGDAVSPARLELCRMLTAEFADAAANPAEGPRAFFARFFSVLAVSLARFEGG